MSFTFSWTIKAGSCPWAFLLWSEDNTYAHVHVYHERHLPGLNSYKYFNVYSHHVQFKMTGCFCSEMTWVTVHAKDTSFEMMCGLHVLSVWYIQSFVKFWLHINNGPELILRFSSQSTNTSFSNKQYCVFHTFNKPKQANNPLKCRTLHCDWLKHKIVSLVVFQFLKDNRM